MAQRLFNRKVILQLGVDGQKGKSFSDLRVRFKVTRSVDLEPDEATITLWNANPHTRALVQQEGALLRLLVGYEVPRLLFSGRPITDGVEITREATDRILKIEAKDGGQELSTQVALNWSTDTTLQQAVEALRSASGLKVGNLDLPNMRIAGGFTLTGTVDEALSRISEIADRRIYIRDGALVSQAPGQPVGTRSVVFSAAAGNLIGSPSSKKGSVKLKALLGGAEGLRPGQPYRVESEMFSGDYIATDVKFDGDSGFAQPYYIEVVGEPA